MSKKKPESDNSDSGSPTLHNSGKYNRHENLRNKNLIFSSKRHEYAFLFPQATTWKIDLP
ncbi:MAG: hypothetical protein CLLPBCKN_001329 [Chroococcidiopsis cubana SAG 39.79]|nr:hypothetical protein [Chroococcidiopsis cubana SAG 39.79]